MSIGRSDTPIKRYFIHGLMLFLGLLAVIPIYVVLINATRTTEQINTGLSILPGNNAFWSSTREINVDWALPGQETGNISEVPDEGTVRFLDLIMGTTLKEVQNRKTKQPELIVVKTLTESRQPRIAIVNSQGETLASYNLTNNAVIYVKNGEKVKRGHLAVKSTTPANVVHNWRALTGRGFQIWQGFSNSAFISISATVLSIYFSALTAYGLHIYRFRGRMLIWAIILVIMMLPGSLTFIGFYQFMARIKLTDTYLPLILPGIAAAATVLFIRQYMVSILSKDLIDAARIDGAGEFVTFNVIILPMIIPALAAQAIFTFVGSWNNFLTPFVIISTQSKYTLPMLIQALRGDIYRTEFGGIYLGIAISLVPIIIFYSFMSRFIISGLTMGGIKE
ncbi:MAG: carbohydrate ABC transporter permease [Treponema sp.]|jgi:multiple sugar transport system permease protein|nr:carbohydrate ABC transporter permease [Treponema sp.]